MRPGTCQGSRPYLSSKSETWGLLLRPTFCAVCNSPLLPGSMDRSVHQSQHGTPLPRTFAQLQLGNLGDRLPVTAALSDQNGERWYMAVKCWIVGCSSALINRCSDPRSVGFLEPETDMLIRTEIPQAIGCQICNSPDTSESTGRDEYEAVGRWWGPLLHLPLCRVSGAYS